MKLKRIIRRVFFPDYCKICGRIIPFAKSQCEVCGIDTKPISKNACPDCGHEKCMCKDGANVYLPHFSAVYYYQGQLKKSLLNYKFNGESYLSYTFGKAMAERIKELYSDTEFDGVCYVPMTGKAERIRGYNQSELLARQIAKELGFSLVSCLEKTKDTYAQKDLSAEERQQNIKNSFKIKKNFDVRGKTFILCDDIKTTGSTLRECTDTLKKAGAKDIYCICLALTPYLNYSDLF